MRNQLLRTFVLCGACLALGAQSQTSSSSPGGSSTDPSSSSGASSSTNPSTTPGAANSSSPSGLSSSQFSPTGRMQHEAVRGSQLTGAQITSSSGSQIGTIADTIVNPASGRLEFAVLSLSSGAGAASSTSTPGATSGTGITSSTSGAGSKQVAVPWMLLRSSMSSASSAAGTSPSMQQPSFVFTGDASKLESAPNFEPNTDLSQPSWRQSVFSYFGLSGRGAFGGAETPGGTSSSGSTIPQSSSPR